MYCFQFVVRRKKELHALIPDAEIFICDYEIKEDIESLAKKVSSKCDKLHGILHSIAFANYSDGMLPFHETKEDFRRPCKYHLFP